MLIVSGLPVALMAVASFLCILTADFFSYTQNFLNPPFSDSLNFLWFGNISTYRILKMKQRMESFQRSGSDYLLQVSCNGEYAQISASGAASSGSMIALFSEISRICRWRQRNRILCELRFTGFETFQDLMLLRANILTCDLPADVRIAIVSHEKNHQAFHQLGTNFYQISGSWTRVFNSIHAAQSWLQLHPPGNAPDIGISPPH